MAPVTLAIPLALPLATENPLLPALPEIIAAVVFVILLTILIAKFVVPRFEATYAERTAAIQGGMEKAEKAQEEAEAALRQYQQQLAEARSEAARIRRTPRPRGRRSWPRCGAGSPRWPGSRHPGRLSWRPNATR